jgi:hypothetical protein
VAQAERNRTWEVAGVLDLLAGLERAESLTPTPAHAAVGII